MGSSLSFMASSAYKESTNQTSESVFERWFPVVKLARMWECDAIHKYAIRNMPYERVGKTLVEKVGLAVRYDIQPWLLPGVNELAQRKEPLGNDDLVHLGPELVLKVAAVRESLSISHGNDGHQNQATLVSGSRDAGKVDFTPVIERVFQLSAIR